MFCFVEKTQSKYLYAENVSALFLCPETTPKYASSEEQILIPAQIVNLLSGDTPADVPADNTVAEYQIVSESVDCSFSVALPLAAADDLIDCGSDNLESEEFITVKNALSEESSPMFLVEKHIPSSFYITVCNGEYYRDTQAFAVCEYRKYSAVGGVSAPHGMELKIRVQSFRL